VPAVLPKACCLPTPRSPRADPLQDISNTQKIDAVIMDGHLFDPKELDSLLDKAEGAVKNK